MGTGAHHSAGQQRDGSGDAGGDIEKVTGQRFTIAAFPLRWYMGDGTMIRMAAITDDEHINRNVPDRVCKYGVN